MSEPVIAKNISLREAGKNEYWLQEQIFENPSYLPLGGELEAIGKERVQSSGGRLDILLKDSEDDTMYEVEVMLGETDETHIIRTIEYYLNESRRWPQRKHYAVLVAEHINRRFFDVIHLLSHSIPIIAIQVSLLEAHGKYSLFFSKVLDTYEEVDDGSTMDNIKFTREDWIKKSKWTVENADSLFEIVKEVFDEPELNYVKHYTSILVSGNIYFWFNRRSQPKSQLGFRLKPEFQEKVCKLLDEKNLSYIRKDKSIRLTIDKKTIEHNKEMFIEIAKIIKENWK